LHLIRNAPDNRHFCEVHMSATDTTPHPIEDPEAALEQALIAEYLRMQGNDARSVEHLADAERDQLLRDASRHAAARLAEIEARAHFVHELHGDK
jgi:hypothetical protein